MAGQTAAFSPSETYINVIKDVLPQWLKSITIKNTIYFKIDLKVNMKTVLKTIENYRDTI